MGLLVPCPCMQQGTTVGNRKERDSSSGTTRKRAGRGGHGACQAATTSTRPLAVPRGRDGDHGHHSPV